jgi:very-short-patch-repair endonuclease/predicted transcriptional regulator of viral defense system
MNPRFDAEVATLAERQHALITITQIRRIAERPRVDWPVERRLTQGQWRSVERGVYAIAGSPDTWRQRVLAGALSLGPTAVASLQSAAALFGVPGFPERPIELLVLRPAQGMSRNGTVFQTKSLPAHHCTVVDAIPVTALPRTIFDLAGHHRMGRVARALDHSLAYGLAPVERFWDVFFDLAKRGRTGTRVMRVLLNERAGNYVAPASELELLFRTMVNRHGLPEPRSQVDVGDEEDWIGRVDFLFAGGLVVETDGRRYHSALLDQQSDAARDARLRASGRRVLRFTWLDITAHEDACVAAIRAQLEAKAA